MYLDKINIMRNENLDIKYGTIPWNDSHSSTLIHSKSRRRQTGFSRINPFGWRKRTRWRGGREVLSSTWKRRDVAMKEAFIVNICAYVLSCEIHTQLQCKAGVFINKQGSSHVIKSLKCGYNSLPRSNLNSSMSRESTSGTQLQLSRVNITLLYV